uniref:Uncharacterized protein n=1 Tax=Rhabditophanes sp. KR3021 TaxID=114890 RepID=A0AC35TSS0_9BILA
MVVNRPLSAPFNGKEEEDVGNESSIPRIALANQRIINKLAPVEFKKPRFGFTVGNFPHQPREMIDEHFNNRLMMLMTTGKKKSTMSSDLVGDRFIGDDGRKFGFGTNGQNIDANTNLLQNQKMFMRNVVVVDKQALSRRSSGENSNSKEKGEEEKEKEEGEDMPEERKKFLLLG